MQSCLTPAPQSATIAYLPLQRLSLSSQFLYFSCQNTILLPQKFQLLPQRPRLRAKPSLRCTSRPRYNASFSLHVPKGLFSGRRKHRSFNDIPYRGRPAANAQRTLRSTSQPLLQFRSIPLSNGLLPEIAVADSLEPPSHLQLVIPRQQFLDIIVQLPRLLLERTVVVDMQLKVLLHFLQLFGESEHLEVLLRVLVCYIWPFTDLWPLLTSIYLLQSSHLLPQLAQLLRLLPQFHLPSPQLLPHIRALPLLQQTVPVLVDHPQALPHLPQDLLLVQPRQRVDLRSGQRRRRVDSALTGQTRFFGERRTCRGSWKREGRLDRWRSAESPHIIIKIKKNMPPASKKRKWT